MTPSNQNISSEKTPIKTPLVMNAKSGIPALTGKKKINVVTILDHFLSNFEVKLFLASGWLVGG